MRKVSEGIITLKEILGDLPITERLNGLDIVGDVSVERLNTPRLLEIIKALGDCMYMTINSQLTGTFVVNDSWSVGQYLETISDLIEEGKDTVTVSIKLIKDRLIQKFIPDLTIQSSFKFILFIFQQYFVNWITETEFDEIENCLSDTQQNIILISDVDCHLENDFLIVFGAKSAEFTVNYLTNNHHKKIDEIKIIELRNISCNWVGSTKFIIPDYLYFERSEGITNDILTAFDIKLQLLVIVFLSPLTQKEHGKRISTVYGYKRIQIDLGGQTNKINSRAFYLLYKWIYESKTADKLGIFHNIVSLYLKDNPGKNLEILIDNIEDISNSVHSSFDIYLKENVKIYFEQRKKIEDLIQSKVSEISKEISSVVDLMSKNLLATVGVVIAGLISCLGKGTKEIIIIALWLYIGSLVINTLYFGIYTSTSVGQIISSFNHFLNNAKKILVETEVDSLVGDVISKREKLFNRVLLATLIISGLLLLCGVYLIFNIYWILPTIVPNATK